MSFGTVILIQTIGILAYAHYVPLGIDQEAAEKGFKDGKDYLTKDWDLGLIMFIVLVGVIPFVNLVMGLGAGLAYHIKKHLT